jgi:hypothetical protein
VLFDTNADTVLDTAFIADERTTTGGGLQKWTLSNSTWSNVYSLLVGPSGNLSSTTAVGYAGPRGLAGSYDLETGAFSLYLTTTQLSDNKLIKIIDSGSTPTSYTELAKAGANYAFRGVDLIASPIPEPSTYAAILGGVALFGVAARRRPSV